ncbi:hydrophobic surface binding protein A-domain-containing protein [Pseudomassariella vexata]|uniref:Hydrophobic surface binding protein A-domain-containing protein n=1 Tax=Pseudomassariella vexata TaxID=1141098 RepID=A0A1Y2D965_9PEZI|nr:hydrophobic surface binding protein A-domain-containing protein [Pseudomassariella vexata]ORY55714.1 hydrophobic surface binding protein A-domain-containing protein [Pseudomassariella vexata]
MTPAFGSSLVKVRQASNATSIVSGLSTVGGSLDSFTTAINAYQSGLLGLIPLTSAVQSVDQSLKTVSKSVMASQALSSQDNAAVAGQISTVLPKVSAAAIGLQKKSAVMKATGAGPFITLAISTIQTDMNDLSSQLQRVMSPQTIHAVQAATQSINTFLSQAGQSFVT